MKSHNELHKLPRKLAERLRFELCPHEMKMNSQLNCVKCVEAVILEAIEQTLESAAQAIEERIKEVATEICKGESATASHALLTHIAIPQALAAIRSLKPAKSDMTQPAEERG